MGCSSGAASVSTGASPLSSACCSASSTSSWALASSDALAAALSCSSAAIIASHEREFSCSSSRTGRRHSLASQSAATAESS